MFKLLQLFSPHQYFKSSAFSCCKLEVFSTQRRSFGDTPKNDVNKQIVVQGNESEHSMRVRRARPADVPRVLRFVREHAPHAPHATHTPAPRACQLVLGDYVARALAQGHSMIAEQREPGRGWRRVRALALCGATCAWDAALLESAARHVRGARARRPLRRAARLLRAPALHHKYRVHNILQVTMIIPPDVPKSGELAQALAKNAIQRGREAGFPLLRFDISDDNIAKSLEELNLRKECHLTYDLLPETLKEKEGSTSTPDPDRKQGSFITVYTAFTQTSATPNEKG